MRRAFIFLAGFTVVLLSGAALAKIGSLPSADDMQPAAAFEEPDQPAPSKPQPVGHDQEVPKEQPAHDQEEPGEEEPKDSTTTTMVDDDAPDIVILHPKDGATVESSEVVFEGNTEPGARVFAGEFEADVNDDGGWRIVLLVEKGTTVATFLAIDPAGNESTAAITLYFQPPDTTTPPKEGDREWGFSANAKFIESDSSPPYDIYWGTGRPGDTIHITSEYGSGTGHVGPDGGWDATVEFPEAPIGLVFVVTVWDSFGGEKHLEFVRLG